MAVSTKEAAVRDGFLREELLFDGHVIELDTEEAFKEYDRRTCDCEKPMVWRSAMPMVGRGVLVRLCCLAKEVETLAHLPKGTLYQVFDFQPTWEWDCDTISETREHRPDGSMILREYRRASPPLWLEKRLVQKGLPIHNQVRGDKRKPVLLRQWRIDPQGNRQELLNGAKEGHDE